MSISSEPLTKQIAFCVSPGYDGAMNDYIHINELTVDASIGVYEHEKTATQPLCFALKLGVDCARVAMQDKLNSTIDYEAVTHFIIAFAKQQHFELIETLADLLANSLLETFNIPWLELTINKPNALSQANVGVVIFRKK